MFSQFNVSSKMKHGKDTLTFQKIGIWWIKLKRQMQIDFGHLLLPT